jgi:hypothetical protein
LNVFCPSGPFAFIIRNASIYGGESGFGFGGGQHCGIWSYNKGNPGSHCTPEFVLEDVDFSGYTGSRAFQYGISGGNPILPSFSSYDGSLNATRAGAKISGGGGLVITAVSGYLTGFLEREGCHKTVGNSYIAGNPQGFFDGSIVCDERTVVRRLNVWTSTNKNYHGDLFLSGPGYHAVDSPNVSWTFPDLGNSGGVVHFDTTSTGFGVSVVANTGLWYNLSIPLFTDDIVLDFSDPPGQFPAGAAKSDVLKLIVNGFPCVLNSSDAAAKMFVGHSGPEGSLGDDTASHQFCRSALDSFTERPRVRFANAEATSESTENISSTVQNASAVSVNDASLIFVSVSTGSAEDAVDGDFYTFWESSRPTNGSSFLVEFEFERHALAHLDELQLHWASHMASSGARG